AVGDAMTSPTCTVNYLKFTSATEPNGNGGGILNFGTLTRNSCTVMGCHAAVDGGAIANNKELWLNGCSITGNSSDNTGGGIYLAGVPGCTAHLTSTAISGNNAGTNTIAGKGGGIIMLPGSTIWINGGVITNNIAKDNGLGGGFYSSGGTANIGS